jgi:C4-dicarboxylate-specific signal transduction histidine kinase
MAQAIAHELNQPLSAVANYARASRSMLADPVRHGALLAETLEKIDREANRAGQVMRRLREFFRGGGLRSENFALTALIDESLSYVRRRAERQNINFEISLDENLPSVYADRVQIGTVLHNLLANAIESDASGHDEPREIEIRAQVHSDTLVVVCITDNGTGVSTEMENRLFESFATSKPEGMGLGLAISRTLVQAHGGELWLANARPAQFCFTLPISGSNHD